MSFLHGHSEHSAELYPLPKCCNNTIEERYSWSTSACLTRDIWRVRIAINLHIFNNRYLFVLGNKMNIKIYALLSCVCVVSSLIFVLFVLSTSCFPALFLLLDQITTHHSSEQLGSSISVDIVIFYYLPKWTIRWGWRFFRALSTCSWFNKPMKIVYVRRCIATRKLSLYLYVSTPSLSESARTRCWW